VIAVVARLCTEGAAQTEVKTTPHACAKDNLPYQVLKLNSTMEMHSWDWISGKRSVHWSHEISKFAQIDLLNGCGISPEDSIAYCITPGYVVRVDKAGFAFVARTPGGRMSVSAGFDEDGTFWAADASEVWKFEGLHDLPGYAEPAATLPEMAVAGPTQFAHGADVVVWEGYLVSVSDGKVVVTDLGDGGLRTFQPTASANSEPLPAGYYGGAYMYSGGMFFSHNDGAGIFNVDLDLASMTYTAKNDGASFVTAYNDGLNCILTEAPETVSGMKDAAGRRGAVLVGASMIAGLLRL